MNNDATKTGGIKINDWSKEADGSYTATGDNGERIYLQKCPSRAKQWLLIVSTGSRTYTIDLGKRATFDHAEGVLVNFNDHKKSC